MAVDLHVGIYCATQCSLLTLAAGKEDLASTYWLNIAQGQCHSVHGLLCLVPRILQQISLRL